MTALILNTINGWVRIKAYPKHSIKLQIDQTEDIEVYEEWKKERDTYEFCYKDTLERIERLFRAARLWFTV